MGRKREVSGGTPATTVLSRLGIDFGVHPYHHDPAVASYGLEAAAALSVPPGQVFKTLLVEIDGGGLAVGIVPVDRSLDLKALAVALGAKRVAMAAPAAAERATGYVLGGISAVGQRRVLPTVLDGSATGFDRIYVSGGRRGLDISLSPLDLVAATRGSIGEISR